MGPTAVSLEALSFLTLLASFSARGVPRKLGVVAIAPYALGIVRVLPPATPVSAEVAGNLFEAVFGLLITLNAMVLAVERQVQGMKSREILLHGATTSDWSSVGC